MKIRSMMQAMGLAMMPGLMLSATPQAQAQAQDGLQSARAAIAADYDRIVKELVTITETPAPPFAEKVRGEWIAAQFQALGLKRVETDGVGNVMGLRRGKATDGAPLLVVSAHLDTVFPEGTNVKVQRSGTTLSAPGVGDDSLGLAAMLAWIRAMDAAGIVTRNDILFVATVGEEGEGDLRGVRFLFTEGSYRNRIGAFISVDGPEPSHLVTGAVGSKRYRIAFTGPGGHSYGAFGIVNPMAAMADTVKRLYEIKVPGDPRTSYSASVVSGGTSVNTIPDRIELLVDMRSPDPAELDRLEQRFLAIVDQAVVAENFARSTSLGEVGAIKQKIGDRPAGQTDPEHPMVLAAQRILTAGGVDARPSKSSTDSNIAMSLGVPAMTIGTGNGGGRAHSSEEYVNVEKGGFTKGLGLGLEIVLASANMDWSAR
ncbi:MAG: M20/M25/M40 family metallo-hydrolase [Blastomonas sp.]